MPTSLLLHEDSFQLSKYVPSSQIMFWLTRVQLHHACDVVAIAMPAKTKQQIAIALSFSFSKNGALSPQLNVGPIALLVTNVFAGKRDRPSSIPNAKPAIALLELVKMCDRFFCSHQSSNKCHYTDRFAKMSTITNISTKINPLQS